MPELQLYEYAVIRVVPRVEREAFFNVGIILFSKKSHYIGCRIHFNKEQLNCFDPGADAEYLQQNLDAFQSIALGRCTSNSPIAQLDEPARFRWLTATRSTTIQCSKVHPGVTHDLDGTLDLLMQHMVL